MDKSNVLDRLASMISYFADNLERDKESDKGGALVLIDQGDIKTLEEAVEIIRGA